MIMPADSPSIAVVSGHGIAIRFESNQSETVDLPRVRLHCNYETVKTKEIIAPGGIRIEFVEWPSPIVLPPLKPEHIISRMGDKNAWTTGRAGMQYRDLIPGKLGGAIIASHIRIPEGGLTPDYVHYHHVLFQMIYCKTGWARLVYEDQGPPFIMSAGDCVLQPPGIRHRVLETSPGFEVIEVGCPAVHETFVDHELQLPTNVCRPEKIFGGQRFLHYIASETKWDHEQIEGFTVRDTKISNATGGFADAQVIRGSKASFCRKGGSEFLFYFVLSGEAVISLPETVDQALGAGDSCTVAGADCTIQAGESLQILEVSVHSLPRI
jgi:quercetin dioxygenase-like cupin family protein